MAGAMRATSRRCWRSAARTRARRGSCGCSRSSPPRASTPTIPRTLRALRGRVIEHLRAEQAAGRVDPGLDPALVASQVPAMFDGPQLQWLLDPDEVDLTAPFADFLKRLQAR